MSILLKSMFHVKHRNKKALFYKLKNLPSFYLTKQTTYFIIYNEKFSTCAKVINLKHDK